MKKPFIICGLLSCSLLLVSCSQKETHNSEAYNTEAYNSGTASSNTSNSNIYSQSEITNNTEENTVETTDVVSTSDIVNSEIEPVVPEDSITYLDDESTATSSITMAGARDNTPVCLVPVASGKTVYSNSLASIDVSNSNEGYIMVNYTGSNQKVKLQITGPDANTYTYNLYKNGYESFPLSSGSGQYKIAVYENISGTSYSTALSQTTTFNITNAFGPYLYPNQYVNFSKDNLVVEKARVLCANSTTDLDVVSKIYNFCYTNITYDYTKAETVKSGYTSNVDEILVSGTGICLDYAAVMASMLRSQGIPTRLEVGYAGTAYHAWISTYISEIGWVNGMIQFDGTNWSLMDPTFASTTDEKILKNFIGDGSNYKVKYIY